MNPCAIVLAMLVLAAPAAAESGASGAASGLEGYWASEAVYPATASGPLTVTHANGGWRAAVAGADVAVAVDGTKLAFTLPDHRGGFRGEVHGDRIEGFWMQPGRPTDADRPLATPLVLHRVAAGAWRGDVVPLADPWSIYLRIAPDPASGLLAAFRNPERNDIGGASRFRVSREGDSVFFRVPLEGGGELRRDGVLLGPDRLRVNLAGDRVELVRRDSADIPRAFARPAARPYAYRAPERRADGWRTARGREVGIDEAALAQVVRRIAEGDPFARQPSLIHSVLVARHGRLVLEEYFFGFDRETPHDVRSAGKTFASVMLGAAMLQGVPIGPETRIYDLLAKRGPFAHPDPRKGNITLAHLLTHTSGLDCDDNDEHSAGNEETMSSQKEEPDWWKYTLDLAVAHDPGSRYAYGSANINLVGAALTEATGTWLPQYFDRTIARPLQFGRYSWNLMPNGEGYLGGGAFLRPRDLLKVGQLYLDGGVWNGRRIVAREWVTRSTAPHVEINEATTGLSEEEFGNYYGHGRDGYAWHLGELRVGDRVVKTCAASGNGGQVLLVVPEYDLVVVFTGGNYRQGGIWGRWGEEFVGRAILPAIHG